MRLIQCSDGQHDKLISPRTIKWVTIVLRQPRLPDDNDTTNIQWQMHKHVTALPRVCWPSLKVSGMNMSVKGRIVGSEQASEEPHRHRQTGRSSCHLRKSKSKSRMAHWRRGCGERGTYAVENWAVRERESVCVCVCVCACVCVSNLLVKEWTLQFVGNQSACVFVFACLSQREAFPFVWVGACARSCHQCVQVCTVTVCVGSWREWVIVRGVIRYTGAYSIYVEFIYIYISYFS